MNSEPATNPEVARLEAELREIENERNELWLKVDALNERRERVSLKLFSVKQRQWLNREDAP